MEFGYELHKSEKILFALILKNTITPVRQFSMYILDDAQSATKYALPNI